MDPKKLDAANASDRSLSRRDLLRGAGAVGAAFAGSSLAAAPPVQGAVSDLRLATAGAAARCDSRAPSLAPGPHPPSCSRRACLPRALPQARTIPMQASLVGAALSTQGVSATPSVLQLTNAIDIVLGNF
jgi:hypothetical protein